jgi:hypothetical protein
MAAGVAESEQIERPNVACVDAMSALGDSGSSTTAPMSNTGLADRRVRASVLRVKKRLRTIRHTFMPDNV